MVQPPRPGSAPAMRTVPDGRVRGDSRHVWSLARPPSLDVVSAQAGLAWTKRMKRYESGRRHGPATARNRADLPERPDYPSGDRSGIVRAAVDHEAERPEGP
jgi:hypothetical protein